MNKVSARVEPSAAARAQRIHTCWLRSGEGEPGRSECETPHCWGENGLPCSQLLSLSERQKAVCAFFTPLPTLTCKCCRIKAALNLPCTWIRFGNSPASSTAFSSSSWLLCSLHREALCWHLLAWDTSWASCRLALNWEMRPRWSLHRKGKLRVMLTVYCNLVSVQRLWTNRWWIAGWTLTECVCQDIHPAPLCHPLAEPSSSPTRLWWKPSSHCSCCRSASPSPENRIFFLLNLLLYF